MALRSTAYSLFAALALTSCRKRPPPPPAVTSFPVIATAAMPAVSALPFEPMTEYHYVQAIGVSDLSVLISIDMGSSQPPKVDAGVPLPPGMTPRRVYLAINLADGCIQSRDSFPMVDEATMRSLMVSDTGPPNGPTRVLPIVNGPVFREQFARKQKLFADFDVNGDGIAAWSDDGKRVLFAADDQMYRSDDGVRFSAIDVNASYAPKLTRDGSVGVYRRCSHPCGGGYRLAKIALGHASSTPRFVVGPDLHDFAFDPGEKSVVYVREAKATKTLCIERLDLEHEKIVTLACEPSGNVFTENVLSMSDDVSFGALQTHDEKMDSHLILYDLRTGVRSGVVDASANVPPVDDDGRIALDPSPGSTDTRVANGNEMQHAGVGEALIWDHQKRLVLLHRDVLITGAKCGVVSATNPK